MNKIASLCALLVVTSMPTMAHECNEPKYQPLVDKAAVMCAEYYGKELTENYQIINLPDYKEYKNAIEKEHLHYRKGEPNENNLEYLTRNTHACSRLTSPVILVNKNASEFLCKDSYSTLNPKEYLTIVTHELIHKYQWAAANGDPKNLPSRQALEKEATELSKLLVKKAKKDKLI